MVEEANKRDSDSSLLIRDGKKKTDKPEIEASKSIADEDELEKMESMWDKMYAAISGPECKCDQILH